MLKTKKINILFVVVFLAVLFGFVWTLIQYIDLKKSTEQLDLLSMDVQKEIMEQELDELKILIGAHIILPDEDPVLATIEDIDALIAENPFFEGAKNGNKVLIYSTMAIIYDLDRDILVNVGPVYGESEKVEEEVQQIMIEVRNGSEVDGATSGVIDQISALEFYDVIRIDSASRNDYTGVTIVNISGLDISQLEALLDASPTPMPEGEYASGADVLIIIGN